MSQHRVSIQITQQILNFFERYSLEYAGIGRMIETLGLNFIDDGNET